VELQAFSLLCGLSSISFIATADSIKCILPWLFGFAIALIMVNPHALSLMQDPALSFEPPQFALLIAITAFLLIMQPTLITPAVFFAGVLAAIWVTGLTSQGYGISLSLLMVVLISITTFYCVLARPDFCHVSLRQEAFIIVLVSAMAMAIVPEIINGWTSAVSLSGIGSKHGNTLGPGILLLVVFFAALGGLYSNWKRR